MTLYQDLMKKTWGSRKWFVVCICFFIC